MAVHLRHLLMSELDELRYEPVEKRIRGVLDGQTVVDSNRAMLVWEPKRVVPTYAFPVEDVHAEIDAAAAASLDAPEGVAPMGPPQLGDRPVYDPSVPFAVHTTDGTALTIRTSGGGGEAGAFRAADPALAGYVVVDFDGFEEWYEEDERNVSHPRDPFHRIDILHSSRLVRVELDGAVLSESSSPYLLFEPPLPVRYYLPTADVRMDLLRPSATRTYCAYKGEASYWSLDGQDDVAWTYREPLREAAEVEGRVAFFNERVDITVDALPLDRPITPWSRR